MSMYSSLPRKTCSRGQRESGSKMVWSTFFFFSSSSPCTSLASPFWVIATLCFFPLVAPTAAAPTAAVVVLSLSDGVGPYGSGHAPLTPRRQHTFLGSWRLSYVRADGLDYYPNHDADHARGAELLRRPALHVAHRCHNQARSPDGSRRAWPATSKMLRLLREEEEEVRW